MDNRETSAKEYLEKGIHCYERRNFDEAIEWFTRSTELNPNVETYDYRGCAYLEVKKYNKAISDHSEAIKLCPIENKIGLSKVYYNRALSYLGQADKGKALMDARKAIEIDLKNREAQRLHASITGDPLPYGFNDPQIIQKYFEKIEKPILTQDFRETENEWRCQGCNRNVKILRVDLYKTDIGNLCALCCFKTGRFNFVKNEFLYPRPLTEKEIVIERQFSFKGLLMGIFLTKWGLLTGIFMFAFIVFVLFTYVLRGTSEQAISGIILIIFIFLIYLISLNFYRNWTSKR